MENIRIHAFADEADKMIDGQIKAMLENDVLGLEIRNVDGVNVSEISISKAKEVRRKLDSHGLITWSIGSPIGKIDIDEPDFDTHIEKFKRMLEVSDVLGSSNIRMFSFFIDEDKNYDDYKNKVIDRLGVLCDIAKGTGIELCHENEKGIFGDNAKRCLELLEAIPTLRCIFDPANFVQSGQDTLEAWKLLGDKVKYMHIKDSLNDSRVVPAGEGHGNVGFIANDFIKKGGRDFTIEPHLKVFDGLAGLEKEENKSEVEVESVYATQEESFAVAVKAFRKLI